MEYIGIDLFGKKEKKIVKIDKYLFFFNILVSIKERNK